jgi:Ti-type conjugative transfer relaxase TraA
MAIQFARIEIVTRSSGGSACCKGAYNARTKVKDEKTNVTYNFSHKGDNVYHTVLLPQHVNKKFSSVSEFMNLVEAFEKRKDSQLLKDIVLALPDDKELSLQDRINITHLLIEKRGWVKEGLGVQVDIHKPHDGEKNWHAHLLVTTRRFTEDGLAFGAKATDLNPEFKKAGNKAFVIPEAQQIHEDLRDIINDYFKMLGLDKRVDSIGINPEEHIGPVRMRSVMNAAVIRNEERKIAEVEHLSNGAAVLDKVTRNMSVFSSSDLKQAVKCIPDKEVQERLIEEALAGESVINLFDSEGRKTNLYTTVNIRAEEEKIMRLTGYVSAEKNVISLGGSKAVNVINKLVSDEKAANSRFSDEQEKALSELLLGEGGVRILRGRAGSGKSYVLGQVCKVSGSVGVNVIGLAPTHKARVELAKVGYEQNDTVKGMLFKLANGRFNLPKASLIVVDEAGMVGNDDYQELLRVAATRKCNVILSGDERQLSSVQRGGMFEVLAEKHGSSTIFDIKRQSSNWGKEVASCFAGGKVLEGLTILENNERIKWGGNVDKSMQELLGDWNSSQYDIDNRIILAVENKHVNALNAGARQYLKANGKLEGEEISVSGNYYMKGDRVLITGTNKELGVINGDLGEVIDASTEKFIISILGSEKTIEFNPKEYDGFKHGYATTIFKAQGASIKDVYVFHDKFSGIRNSYVSLSRHIDELKLYTNRESTADINILEKQLSRDFDKGSSLQYSTEEEIRYRNNVEVGKKTLKGKFLLGVVSVIDKVLDKYIPSSEYYNYKEPTRASSSVEQVIDNVALEEEATGFSAEHKIAVGENGGNRISDALSGISTTNKPRMSAKERFYANADYARGQRSRVDLKAEWDKEAEELRHHLKFKSEIVARDLLGEPNKRLSNGRELRYGEHGKIAVRISGEKAGMWHDFSSDKGGDLFDLVQHVRGGEFKTAAEYLRGVVGIKSTGNLRLVYDHNNSNEYVDRLKAKRLEEQIDKQKVKVTSDLLLRAKEINHKNVAYRYLREVRNISCELGGDIKTTGIYDREAGKSFPALIAFARDEGGNVTGGQRLLLDGKSGGKAKVDVPKKSFGYISGSFVEVSNPKWNSEHLSGQLLKSHKTITIIAEGLETALSVKQALGEHSEKKGITNEVQILCSLGISNIKNYRAKKGEKIIIAADNDGEDSITGKTTLNAKVLLEEKGAFVEVVKPDKQGDFNDLLKAGDSKLINSLFAPAIASHSAKTLQEYVNAKVTSKPIILDENDKANLAYIESRNINQEGIINAWRKSELAGKIELDDMRKKVSLAEHNLEANSGILDLAQRYKININKGELLKDLTNNLSSNAEETCINYVLGQFAKGKQEANKIGKVYSIIKSEDGFLSELKVGNKEQLTSILKERIDLSQSGESINILGSIKENLEANHKQGIIPYRELKNTLVSFGFDINKLNTELNKSVLAGREKHLQYVSLEINELDKLGSKYDKDIWVRDLKDAKTYKEMKAYAQNILGLEAKKYLEPTFLKLENERLNTGNFWQFLNVVAKEQQAHIDIREKHRFAVRAIDRINGDLKYTLATTHACDIKSAVTTQKAIGLIGYAAKNNIVSEQKIRDDINGNNGEIRNIYRVIKFKCDAINEQKIESHKAKQQEIEKQNQHSKDMSRGRGGMSL